jgi:serine/threonine-protein kinase RsbW
MTPTAVEDVFRLEFSPDAELISTARLFAAAAARYFGCGEDIVQDVKIAVSEACTNAVKAHAATIPALPVHVIVSRDGRRIEFEVVDNGGGFDRDGATAVRGNGAEAFSESGIGLQIIQTLFPDVEIGRNAHGGTTVRFSTLPED